MGMALATRRLLPVTNQQECSGGRPRFSAAPRADSHNQFPEGAKDFVACANLLSGVSGAVIAFTELLTEEGRERL